ncbi:MAG: phage tail tape measure protein, partial [Pseudomonadota bacterium]
MSDLNVSLIVALKDLVTGAPADKLKATFAGLGAGAKQAGKDFTNAIKRGFSADNIDLALQQNERKLQEAKGRLQGALAMAATVALPIKLAVDFESSMADIAKVVDFETPEGFKQMSADILAMSNRIPMAASGIADIVAAAGQAGMEGSELLAFAEIAAKVGVAFEMSADQTGTALAKMKTALGLTVAETGLLADAINHLSNSSAAAAPDLVEFMSRAASVGEQYGFASNQTAAIGAAMIAAGAGADVAATSFRSVGRALTKGANHTKAAKKALKGLGLDAVQVSKNMQEDAVGTMIDVIERIKEMPKHLQASTISTIFGEEARAISPLIGKIEKLRELLKETSDPETYAGSSDKEYAARAATTANNFQLLKNQLNNVGITIGTVLLPPLNELVGKISGAAMAASEWAAANPELTSTLVKAAAGLMVFSVASRVAAFAFYGIRGPLIKTTSLFLKFSKEGKNISMVANAMRGLKAAAGFGFGGIAAAAKGALGLFAGLVGAVTWPIAGVVAALVGAGVLINRYWEPISNFASGFASAIGAELSAGAAAIGQFVADVGGYVGTKLIDFGEWLGLDRATLERYAANSLRGLQNMGRSIVSFFTELPSQIGDWFGDLFTVKDYSAQAEADFQAMGASVG